jgi:carbon-monoxide dehydrogenase medium subunit
VKPVDFELHRPETISEAVDLLARYADEGKVLAGGQSLVPLLNFRLARPEHLIDLSRIGSLNTLSRTAEQITIGAMVTYEQAERSHAVRDGAPLIAAALPSIAHQAIRTRGTIGGSIAHGDPAAELPAVVVALDVTLVAVSQQGTREIAAKDFFVANLVTALAADELLTEVRVRPAYGATGAAFEEVGRRQGDFALAGAGAQMRLNDDGTIAEARIGLTGVASKPYRASDAEALLLGQPLTAELLEAVADAVRSGIDPSGDLHATADYRRDVAGTLAGRVVATAVERAGATHPVLEGIS